MANNLRALNDALFRELERLESCSTKDELERECSRAREVSNLAGNIIGNAKHRLGVKSGTHGGRFEKGRKWAG